MSPARSCDARAAHRAETHSAPQPKTAVDDEREHDERNDHDDPLLDLPPLTEGDEDEDEESFEELLQTLNDADGGLDDATAGELDVGVELAALDAAPEDDELADGRVDVGALDEGLLDAGTGSWVADEKPDDGGAEDDVDEDDGGTYTDDGGVEGTDEDPADDVDERELPALDADHDGDYEAEDLLAELPELADDQPPGWDALPWVVVEGAGAAVPCSALAVAGGHVIAGGAAADAALPVDPTQRAGGRARRADRTAGDRGTLLVVDPGALTARRAGVDASASSIAISDGVIVVASRRGNLLVSADQGRTATLLGAWGAGGSPLTLATTPGRLWVLSGGTLWSPSPTATAGRSDSGALAAPAGAARRDAAAPSKGALSLSPGPAVREGVLRMDASAGVVVALASAPSGPQIERLRGDDERSPAVPLSGAARRAAEAEDGRLAAAAGGRTIALSGAGVLCVSRDGGETFRVIEGLPPVGALAFAGDQRTAPLLALVALDGGRRAQLIQVPSSSAPTVVAELEGAPLGAADDDPGVFSGAALAWDASREVAWVACGAGLIALTRQRKH